MAVASGCAWGIDAQGWHCSWIFDDPYPGHGRSGLRRRFSLHDRAREARLCRQVARPLGRNLPDVDPGTGRLLTYDNTVSYHCQGDVRRGMEWRTVEVYSRSNES